MRMLFNYLLKLQWCELSFVSVKVFAKRVKTEGVIQLIVLSHRQSEFETLSGETQRLNFYK